MCSQRCQHCKTKPANRYRGLCWSCFENRGVRDLYPSRQLDTHEATASRPCTLCGCFMSRPYDGFRLANWVCTTCILPEPERSFVRTRLEHLEQRAALGLPLFAEEAAA